ncbi:GNAT family N-acetyltransferase [Geminocystis sp. GBBB08]|uniref:GNAT family N-acetyltransferase n=1 Tax=Geminocystis sp. GBBB08 TaxID=2604140 RepID=UPI0027E278AD|nr:GNAT family N-acetyltransferase [Geminocystis sp. GBBB08]MBL1211191.1 GNAT family N-acetyltransferase [Geminocystis sp. GBBB08]
MANNNLNIHRATINDVENLFNLIKCLAEYEKLSHQMTGNIKNLEKHLFGNPVYAEAIIAKLDHKSVGFALFFTNYSTFLTKPGIYLEDLFVLPEYRFQGIGKSLLNYLINLAKDRDFGRVEWSVLDWNQSAINFYEKIGAKILPDWRICRVIIN